MEERRRAFNRRMGWEGGLLISIDFTILLMQLFSVFHAMWACISWTQHFFPSPFLHATYLCRSTPWTQRAALLPSDFILLWNISNITVVGGFLGENGM